MVERRVTGPLPMLVFDGACGFCTASATWVLRHAARPVDAEPWQRLDVEALGLTTDQVRRWAWWVDLDGSRHRGHRAVGRALVHCRSPWPALGRLIQTPPFSWMAAPWYRLVSRARRWLPGTQPACSRSDGWPSSTRATSEWESS